MVQPLVDAVEIPEGVFEGFLFCGAGADGALCGDDGEDGVEDLLAEDGDEEGGDVGFDGGGVFIGAVERMGRGLWVEEERVVVALSWWREGGLWAVDCD